MAECLECLDNLSVEDLIALVVVCDENGSVAWNLKSVEFDTDCHSCTATFNSSEDLLRKSITCEDGVYYLQVVSST